MDIVTTLNFFDKFHANHKRTCGAERLDVDAQAGEGTGAIRLILACPTCHNTISGSVQRHEWPQVVDLLSDRKRN